jgi:hypothetical protein
MFKRMLAVGTAAALLGLGPVAVQAKTHHHMTKHHMMTSSHSMMMHKKMQCRDKKTGRFVKCSTSSGSM